MTDNHATRISISGSKKLIFLVGMPAVGKTYWGERIAKEYGLRFIDLDAYIEKHTGATISAFFASGGADIFREKEHEYLHHVIQAAEGDTIIACGGGTPCYYHNMKLMKMAGTVIYLVASIPHILANLRRSANVRPLLTDVDDLDATLADLLSKRSHIYEEADYILQTEDISIATFGEIISSCISKL